MKTSVVIAARTGYRPVLNALASLAALKERSRLEVLVVNCSGEDIASEIAGRFPAQPVIEVSADFTLERARQTGLDRSSGSVVVILHERYTVSDAWLAALEDSHREGFDVVGGVVAPSSSLTSTEWAMYLTEYAHIAPPVLESPLMLDRVMGLPTGNISYRKCALNKVPMWQAMEGTAFLGALYRAGLRFVCKNNMRAEFGFPNSMDEYLAERRQVSHQIAVARARGMSNAGRAWAAAARLALPPLLTLRMFRRVMREPSLRRRFWPSLPWILQFSFVQMAAEMKGFLSAGRSVQLS